MNIFQITSYHRISKRYWKLCAEDYGYSLFSENKPKAVAEKLIRMVFSENDISKYQFAYKVYRYRGKNNLQDRIEVYCFNQIKI